MSAINHFIKKGIRQAEIDEYLANELKRAGYGGVDISKTPLGERITIHASRPGIVIGRRGKNIRMITDELSNRFGLENPQIEVKEVDNPELNAKVMAYSLVSAIERGVHRRRAAYSALRRILNAGAKGCEIIIAGKLTSKRSRHEAYRMGFLAKSGEIGSELVESANAIAVEKLGTIGVTVSIMRGDIPLPDEIDIQSINLDVEEEIIDKEISPEKEPKKPEAEEKVAPKKEEEAKKTPKVEKEPISKKTDLDLKVEELSDLIEKTPGEDKKAPTKKEEEKPKTTTEKKPEPAKITTTKKEVDDKAKTEIKKAPSKDIDTKTKTDTKKPTTTTKKADDKTKVTDKKTDTKAKTTTTKKTDDKEKSDAKKTDNKAKTDAKKTDSKAKTTTDKKSSSKTKDDAKAKDDSKKSSSKKSSKGSKSDKDEKKK